MRILLLTETLSAQGGAERFVVELARELATTGHDCEVASLWAPYELESELERSAVRVHHLGLPHRWRVEEGIFRLANLMQAGAPDIAHAHTFFPAFYLALAGLVVRRPRRVVTVHTVTYDRFPARRLRHRARKRIDKWTVRNRAHQVVAVSEAVARHHAEQFGIQPPLVIPNGIRLEPEAGTGTHRDAIRVELGVGKEEAWIVCPGRLIDDKGHVDLLDALEIARSRGVVPRVDIVGDGPRHAMLEAELARRKLVDSVRLAGRVPHVQLRGMMAAASAVVIPSRNEGFPVTVLEAMASGTPLIATAVGGVPEVVHHGESGWLVPARDPRALASALGHVLADASLRRRLRLGALERIPAYSINEVARRHEKLYRRLLGPAHRGTCY